MQTKLIPVIHYENDEQVLRNAERAYDAECAGVFLIHMKGQNELLAPAARRIKEAWPSLKVGVNYLGRDPAAAVAANIREGFDMTWTDAQLTHSGLSPWADAARVKDAMVRNEAHNVFVGVAFKHQRHEPTPELAALKALEFGFIPTTSGEATGVAAEVGKVAALRAALGTGPLAIASGITPDNAHEYAPNLSHVLVATGVSTTFYELDFEALCRLRSICARATA